MGARYLVELADVLAAAGLPVVTYAGWETRARSSGGFDPGRPSAVAWHHTASSTSPANDAAYMCEGSADRPIANILVARDGAVWVLAAGATNTNGKGGPLTLPDGAAIPLDAANVHVVGVEIANNGVGEAYPAAQIDAAFTVSLALARLLDRRPDNVFTHYAYAPTRKIDPATATAVQGAWRPGAVTSSGSWSLADLRAELNRRAATPAPPPEEDDDMAKPLIVEHRGALWVLAADLSSRMHLVQQTDVDALMATGQYLALGPALSEAQVEAVPVASG